MIKAILVSHLLNLPDSIPILIGQVGSKAYGTDTENSDDDYMSVCLATKNIYLGLDNWHNTGTYELKVANGDPIDSVAYEFKKFIRLCQNFNPNVIPLLYLRPQDYAFTSNTGNLLLHNRDMFISKQLYAPFIGYANSQLHKIKNGLTGKLGQKRKELVAEFGYDTKFSYHTIRLLRMGIETLQTGHMNVYRGNIDASELLDIRYGKWSIEKFLKEADDLFNQAEDAWLNSKLPETPDYTKINQFVMDSILKMILAHTGPDGEQK